MFGGAYLQREIWVSKSIGLACSGKEIYHFCFVLHNFVFKGKFQVQARRGGLYLERRFNGGFFVLQFWGAYIWRGLFSGILQYFKTLSNGPAQGIEPATSSFAVRCSPDWTNPSTVDRMNNFYTFQRNTSVYSVSRIFLLYHFLYKWWEFVAAKIPHIS